MVKSSNVINKPQGSPARPKFGTPKKSVGAPPNSPAKNKGTDVNRVRLTRIITNQCNVIIGGVGVMGWRSLNRA